MQRDIVIVPCYERPEYTRVCLEYLSRARGVWEKEIWLRLDRATDEIIEGMSGPASYGYATFGPLFNYRFLAPHETYGNTKNIFEAMRHAYNTGAKKVFLVEDDIMVAPDFFEWHRDVLETVHPFISCATSLNKSAHFQINGPQAMDESIVDPNAYKLVWGAYSSHAAAFTNESLGEIVRVFANDDVYRQAASGNEQDLMIQRFMADTGFQEISTAWPYVPRAFNVGMYSYHINSAMKFNGANNHEKSCAVRNTITDAEKLKRMSANNAAITAVPEKFQKRTGPLVRR